MDNTNAKWSASVKSGTGMIFIDLKTAKNGKEFLSISHLYTQKNDKKRATVLIFGANVEHFKRAIADVPNTDVDEETSPNAGGDIEPEPKPEQKPTKRY